MLVDKIAILLAMLRALNLGDIGLIGFDNVAYL